MARKGFVSGERTVTDVDASTAAEKAKAVEIKKQLERLVKAIVDEDDYRVETTDEAIRTLASLKDLKSQKSFSFNWHPSSNRSIKGLIAPDAPIVILLESIADSV